MNKTLRECQLDFLNLRFGMFVHFNMATFHGEEWAAPHHDPQSFNPTRVDCDQWARAAASAGMTYAVLTTKHHDGFCLWPTKTTAFNVTASPYKGDIVGEFAAALRRQGLKVGLYFSIMDFTHDINRGKITAAKIAMTKAQISELLSGYGDVLCLVLDAWNSPWGGPDYQEMPYGEIYEMIKSLQPHCLVINHDGIPTLEHSDIVHCEETYGQWISPRNIVPSQQGPVLQGPDAEIDPQWFWKPYHATAVCKSVAWVVHEHLEYLNARACNLLLNAAPNPRGSLDDNAVARLAEIGRAWKRPAPLTRLPDRPEFPAPRARASTTLDASHAAQNAVDGNPWTWWEPAAGQTSGWIEVDLGQAQKFNRVYLYQLMDWGRQDEGITSWEISVRANSGTWQSMGQGGMFSIRGLKSGQIAFADVTAQHIRLEVHSAKVRLGIRELQVYFVTTD